MLPVLDLSPAALASRIRERALAAGFDSVGIAPSGPSAHADAYRRWAEAGYAGEMGYLLRPDAVERRGDTGRIVPGARSAVVVTRNYYVEDGDPPATQDPSRGVVARYARGDDYHELLRDRLIELQAWIDAELQPVGGRAYVDTGPVLERELAQRAGLGWFGRNTMLIQPRRGSYHFLGVLLLDVELEPDPPFRDEFCGTCTRCLSACPTGALLGTDESGAPRIDARRCISYLTIELKGPIPRELRPLIGNRIYGCDICQEVCPHNSPKFVEQTDEAAFLARDGLDGPSLIEWMGMTQEQFSTRFRGYPIKRAKRRGLLRNVAVALGNGGSAEAVPALVAALGDDEALVRGHAAWALGRIGTDAACEALRARLEVERDGWVGEEVEAALDSCGDGLRLPAGRQPGAVPM